MSHALSQLIVTVSTTVFFPGQYRVGKFDKQTIVTTEKLFWMGIVPSEPIYPAHEVLPSIIANSLRNYKLTNLRQAPFTP